jgi:hypothetical protein
MACCTSHLARVATAAGILIVLAQMTFEILFEYM